MSAPSLNNDLGLRFCGSWGSPGKYPIIFFASTGFSIVLISSTESEPSEGFKKPIKLLIVVDFPAPLGPSKPFTSPLSTEILMSETPLPFLYFIVRFLISIII